MRFPPYLLPGDRVVIVSPAGKVDTQVVERGAELLRQQGFEVGVGRHACDEDVKASGILDRISGLLVGHFTKMRDGQTPFGKNAWEIIREAVEPWDYPVVFGFPAGHELPNDPLLMGGMITLDVSPRAVQVNLATDSLTA